MRYSEKLLGFEKGMIIAMARKANRFNGVAGLSGVELEKIYCRTNHIRWLCMQEFLWNTREIQRIR